MPSSFTVLLDTIACHKPSESKSDELYCTVVIYGPGGEKQSERRMPENEIWSLSTGQSVAVKEALADLKNTVPETLRVLFHEEDVPSFSRKLFSKLSKFAPKHAPDLIDDCLGEFYIIRDRDDDFTIKEGLNAAFIETQDEYYHIKIKQPNNYDYTIMLDIQEHA